MQNQYNALIIGAGPAGLMAAVECRKPGDNILIIEKMPKPALKLRITGKGRCNITNDAPLKQFISHFGKNGVFLHSAFSQFFNKDLIEYFEKLGVKFKLERGGRWFPESDSAVEIADALVDKVKKLGMPISTNTQVADIAKLPDGKFSVTVRLGFKTQPNIRMNTLHCDKIILATGGKSYPQTGSDGSGLKLAEKLGHTVTPLSPTLVPLVTRGSTAKKLQGLSLKNVTASVWCNNKKITEEFGEMLFTDFGLSGPIILSLSHAVVKLLNQKKKVSIAIDFRPALDLQKLDLRLLREIHEHGKQSFKTLLTKLLPNKLVPVFIDQLKITHDKKLAEIKAEERKKLKMLLKNFILEVTGYKSYEHAIATKGGINIREINPKTMESKIVPGLYFAGEIIDIDADTGGYNLQAAFSTGWVCGRNCK